MTITKEQLTELEEASKPLWKFLAKYCHPHCQIIIDHSRVELVEGVGCGVNSDYDPDPEDGPTDAQQELSRDGHEASEARYREQMKDAGRGHLLP